jgi:hypothetical protein
MQIPFAATAPPAIQSNRVYPLRRHSMISDGLPSMRKTLFAGHLRHAVNRFMETP